jgi:hypothetical protein
MPNIPNSDGVLLTLSLGKGNWSCPLAIVLLLLFERRTMEKVPTVNDPICNTSSSCRIVRKQHYRGRLSKNDASFFISLSILLPPLIELLVSPITLDLLKVLDVWSWRQIRIQMLKITHCWLDHYNGHTLSKDQVTCDGQIDFSWVRNRIAVIWLITLGGGGGKQNRPCVLATLNYEGVKLERRGRLVCLFLFCLNTTYIIFLKIFLFFIFPSSTQ